MRLRLIRLVSVSICAPMTWMSRRRRAWLIVLLVLLTGLPARSADASPSGDGQTPAANPIPIHPEIVPFDPSAYSAVLLFDEPHNIPGPPPLANMPDFLGKEPSRT